MNSIDLILLNLEEVRRRSVKVWRSIPQEYLNWKPDPKALSCLEMIHHVLAAEYSYHQIIIHRGSIENFESPFKGVFFNNTADLLEFANPYRKEFLNSIAALKETALSEIRIDRSDLFEKGYTGYIRSLGDFLLRIPYHEAVHTGQLLAYLRTVGVERPDIWD
ncbi:DinB family protein [Bacillus sp. CECT 9360]|uniref:DinB family protein n=1 Tax=Bacillus sp. CECT 9360 TaxID=2845821 RepID=UPI001E36E2B1|nr:DinB family protein [Bacillus sp. CECT 9360]CAH0346714.1 hypothetical protein BCI9360_03059 [Bacillus sp. CECT 9360]